MPEFVVPIQQNGAVVNVLVRPAGEQQEGIQTWAYLDTGASETAIELNLATGKGFTPVGSFDYFAPGSGLCKAPGFELELALVSPTREVGDWIPVRALGTAVSASGCNVALGRDFLARFRLDYDGPNRRVTVQW
jgi:hypothetical protein